MVTYRLQNPGNAALPVEVEVFKRTFDENQQEVLVPAEDDFIVLPPQIEVPANGYQVFRAKYLAKPDLPQTSSYRIVFKQLPLSDEKAQSGVKMMFNFATLVFVNPQGVIPKATSQLKCPKLTDCKLTIGNQGKRVLDLANFDYVVEHVADGGKTTEQTIGWQQFQGVTKGRFIMPTHQVELDLKSLLKPLGKDKTIDALKMVDLLKPDQR
jgi:P pilus assembly chaperone PapD